MKLTIKNFWDESVGEWEEIKGIPDGFTQFAKSKSSTYFTNDAQDTVVRYSDHWGSGVRYCNWYLKGYKRGNCAYWKQENADPWKYGIIKIDNLIDIRFGG